jgi:hypothetical protein
MRVVLSTPLVLDRLNRGTRPYNFIFCPLVDGAVGYPCDMARTDRTLIAPFSKHREAWIDLPCVNVRDGRAFTLALEQDAQRSKVIPQTYGYVLHFYPHHKESKSLAPDACRAATARAVAAATCARRCWSAALRWQGNDRRWLWRGFELVAVVEGSGVSTTDDGSGSRAMREGRCCWRARLDAGNGFESAHTRSNPSRRTRPKHDDSAGTRSVSPVISTTKDEPPPGRLHGVVMQLVTYVLGSSKARRSSSHFAPPSTSRHPRAVGSSGNQLAPGFDPENVPNGATSPV